MKGSQAIGDITQTAVPSPPAVQASSVKPLKNFLGVGWVMAQQWFFVLSMCDIPLLRKATPGLHLKERPICDMQHMEMPPPLAL